MATMERGRRGLRNLMWFGAAGLLAVPAVAMWLQVDGVDWGALDFVVMAVMLATLCGLVELGARLSPHPGYRLGFAVAAVAGFLTVWVNLAVGMIGDGNDPRNLVFAGVLAVAGTGAVACGFRAAGLVRVMLATAAAQLAAAAYAAIVATPHEGGLIALFALPWLVAAGLFRWGVGGAGDAGDAGDVLR